MLHRLTRHADVQLQRPLHAGLEKTRILFKNPAQWFFFVFFGFFGFFYKYIFSQKTEFLGFFFQFQEHF
jgi:hypothetical protein